MLYKVLLLLSMYSEPPVFISKLKFLQDKQPIHIKFAKNFSVGSISEE